MSPNMTKDVAVLFDSLRVTHNVRHARDLPLETVTAGQETEWIR